MRHPACKLADDLHFLGLDEQRLQSLAFGPRFDFLHGAAHRRDEPCKAVLKHIIGRAVLERIDGHLFAERAGHQDDRQVRPSGLCDLCGRKSIECRKREIRKDQIYPAPFQGGDKIVLIIHPGDRAGDARGFQRELNEICVVRVILEVQDVQGKSHWVTSHFPGSPLPAFRSGDLPAL